MNAQEIDHQKARLEERAGGLRVAIAAGEQADASIAPDSSLGRLTRVDALQAQQMAQALVQRSREELGRITRALARIESGEWGGRSEARASTASIRTPEASSGRIRTTQAAT